MADAYSFVCQYSSTDRLCARLNELGWEWQMGDSYWYGDYVAATPFPGVRIRIVDFPKKVENGWLYDSDIRIRKECDTPMSKIDEAYRRILTELPATNIQEIESFD